MKSRTMMLLGLLTLLPLQLHAAPIKWAGNGHSYEVVAVQGGISWTDAKMAAEAMGGYLATITSMAENDWVFNTLAIGNSPYWLGGYQTSDAASPSSDWNWVSGEDFTFTNWAGGEPNDGFAGENNEENALAWAFFSPSKWNDAPTNYLYRDGGYVVEYNAPEPAVVALVGLMLGGLVAVRRRKA